MCDQGSHGARPRALRVVEIKSIDKLMPVHHKQLLTYLRLSKIKKGLLINFNERLLKDGLKSVVA
jgi:GxxExxY protein